MSTPSQVLVVVITSKGVESRRGVPKRDIERTGISPLPQFRVPAGISRI